jgi:uncharacterized protein
MIDAHIHVTHPRLPGIKSDYAPWEGPIDELATLLKSEMKQAGVTQALAMGLLDAPNSDPLGINGILRLASLVPGLHPIGAIDPTRTSTDHFRLVEKALQTGKVKALKAYLGYRPQGPDHPGYRPYYELAEKYNLPVVFHTGDTHSTSAKLRFAHPLLVDDVAVDHPRVRFVLAHFGNPWLLDGAAVVFKNPNVWADLSGLIVGAESLFRDHFRAKTPVEEISDAIVDVRKAMRYAGKPDRFLFGSDWPLAPMASYRGLIERIVPAEFHPAVFEANAQALFNLPRLDERS